MNGATAFGLPSVLGVISAMITPAILILATGSLVASTLSRIARVFDRARDLLARTVAARERGDELAVRTFTRWLRAEIAHALGEDWHSALDDEGPGESARASTIVG